jgi:signal transduction histidine kinase
MLGDSTGGGRTRREWALDVGAFAFALVFGALSFADAVNGTTTSHADAAAGPDKYISPVLVAADLAFGLLACLAVWYRRRWPLGVAAAAVAISSFSAMATGAAMVAVFGLAVRRPLRDLAAVAVLFLVSIPIYETVHPKTDFLPDLLLASIGFGAIVGWGRFVRARHELVRSLADRAERAESEQQLRVEHARSSERARIAREMHDVLGHRLSLLSLHAGALEFSQPDSPEEIAHEAAVIRENAKQAMEDLREVVGVLREAEGTDGAGPPEGPQPTLEQLPGLIDESRAAGMDLEVVNGLQDLSAVPDAVGRHAYRILQEGLTNARKHAEGCAVKLRVEGKPGAGLELELRNRLPVEAAATASEAGSGSGLVGLSERAALAGGRLDHGETDGDFRLWAWLPWPP